VIRQRYVRYLVCWSSWHDGPRDVLIVLAPRLWDWILLLALRGSHVLKFGEGFLGGCARLSGCLRMSQDVSGCVRMCQDVSGCVRMCQDVSGCVRMCHWGNMDLSCCHCSATQSPLFRWLRNSEVSDMSYLSPHSESGAEGSGGKLEQHCKCSAFLQSFRMF